MKTQLTFYRADELKNNYLWWNGPAWLCNANIKRNEFPNNNKQNISAEVVAEEKYNQ